VKKEGSTLEELPQIKFNNELILTTEQLAEFYGTTEKAIKQNFNNNKDKFIEGKHYFKLQGEKLKMFKLQVENFDLQISSMTRSLYLWTKRGAARHSKMVGTDRAWDVFDQLEENYFNPQLRLPQKPMSATEQLSLAVKSVLEIDDRVTTLEDTMRVSGVQEQQLRMTVNKHVMQIIGGKKAPAYSKLGSSVFQQCWHDFKRYFEIPRYGELPRIKFDEGIRYVEAWLPDTETRLEIANRNAQGELFE
jgi:hypothetical protein